MDTLSYASDTASQAMDTTTQATMDSIQAAMDAWNQTAPAAPSVGAGTIAGIVIGYLVVIAFFVFVCWKIFVKAGKPGWACIVPIYNAIVMLEIVKRPLWWILLCMIPFVNIVVMFILVFDLARKFGKGKGFGLGLAFLGFIFYPVLAFGDAKYNADA